MSNRAYRFMLVALAVVAACRPLAAQDGPTAGTTASADPAAAQLTALFARGANNLVVLAGPATGAAPASGVTTYEAVFGNLGSGPDPETAAKAFVTSFGKILNFPDGAPLSGDVKKFREWSGDDGKVVSYAPTSGGDFYLPGAVTFVFKPSGSLVAVIGRFKPIVGAPGGATTAEQAKEKALEEMGNRFPESRGDITGGSTIAQYLCDSWLDSGIERTFWCEFTVGNPGMPKRALVEGSAGAVIHIEDGGLHANSAHIFDLDPRPTYSTSTRDLEDLVDPGFWHDWTINGTHFKVSPRLIAGLERAEAWTGWFDDAPLRPSPNPCFAEEMIYYQLSQGRKKALGWGATTDLARHDPMYFNHWQVPRCGHFQANSREERNCEAAAKNQAWFNPGDLTLNFSSVNPSFSGRHPGYDGTVILHEYGHFVHKMLSEHFMLGASSLREFLESIAVTEAFADVFSCSVTDQPKVAEWLGKEVRLPNGRTEDKSRNLETMQTVAQVTGGSQPDPHDMAAAYATSVWKLRTDSTLSKDDTIKTLIAAMRLCKLPCNFRNAALAFLAADQMLAGTPHTRSIATLFHTQGLVPPLKTTAGP